MRKYILTDETKERNGITFHRIQAVRSFGNVEEGEKGGWIEKEENLSHEGDCWVFGNARVSEDTEISGNAVIWRNAEISGNTEILENTVILGNAMVESKRDYICFSPIGSRLRSTTFYKTRDGAIHVRCGCFSGSIEEFQKQVAETHGTNKFAKEYNLAIELAKIHILGESE